MGAPLGGTSRRVMQEIECFICSLLSLCVCESECDCVERNRLVNAVMPTNARRLFVCLPLCSLSISGRAPDCSAVAAVIALVFGVVVM